VKLYRIDYREDIEMFSVLFEVHPRPDQWDAYLGHAKKLRPDLEQVEGFVDNIRYRSLTRDGWILSLSNWRDEKSLIRWRRLESHRRVQEKGRDQILRDYHLRVGQITQDTRLPPGLELREQRLDETEVGEGTTVTLIDAPAGYTSEAEPGRLARSLGLDPTAHLPLSWDVFDAVLSPGDLILLASWPDDAAARAFEKQLALPERLRLRRVRIIRDYGMYDRREAPQYYPDVPLIKAGGS
jgi:heme-degrading monooxygenase HmoA